MRSSPRPELSSTTATTSPWAPPAADFTGAPHWPSSMEEIQISSLNDQYLNLSSISLYLNPSHIPFVLIRPPPLSIAILSYRYQKIIQQQQINQIMSQSIISMLREQEKTMCVLISGRIYEEKEILSVTARVIDKFVSLTSTTFYAIDARTCNKIKQLRNKATCLSFNRNTDANKIDYVVTIGGDGTILYAAKEFSEKTPPFLTFQLGTLGFLCKFRVEQLQSTIQKAVNAKQNKYNSKQQFPFEVSTLMRLKAVVNRQMGGQKAVTQQKTVLNEVAITRKDYNRITLDIWINDQKITTTSGDGMLISTPTGSTAYALSSGGPVVLNGVNTIVLVPIAPNSLSFRPICLPSSSNIRLKMNKSSRSAGLVSFDGQSSIQITNEDEIQIWHGKESDKNNDIIIYEPKINSNDNQMPTWMNRLKHFLGWNQVFKSPKCIDLNKDIDKIQIPQCTHKNQDNN